MNRTSQILISCISESFVLHSWDCRDVPTLGGPDLVKKRGKKVHLIYFQEVRIKSP